MFPNLKLESFKRGTAALHLVHVDSFEMLNHHHVVKEVKTYQHTR